MNTAVNAELADVAKRRSSTWWLLSRLVSEQPQDPWLGELESVLSTVEADPLIPLGLESASLLSALRSARVDTGGLTTLAVDRTNLLAGVLHKSELAAPFESSALGQEMNSDLVMDVIQCYQEAGLVDFGLEQGPPDYLGTELRFMSVLAYQEMVAHHAADLGLAAQWLAMQRHFLDTHLLNWIPEHCERMSSMAKTPFYQATAALLRAACLLDQSDLKAIAEQLRLPVSNNLTSEVGT